MVEFWSVLIGRIGKIPFVLYRLPKVKRRVQKLSMSMSYVLVFEWDFKTHLDVA